MVVKLEPHTGVHIHIKKLETFHLCRLCSICGIRWQDMIFKVEVLEMANMPGIEYFFVKSQFRQTGHLIRMSDDRIPSSYFLVSLLRKTMLSQNQNYGSKTH